MPKVRCVPCNVLRIPQLDATTWTPLGDSASAEVAVLEVFLGRLVAAGGISSGGEPPGGVSAWTGQGWYPLGVGAPWGRCLLAQSDTLYVGGNFLKAGPYTSYRIAPWIGDPASDAPEQAGPNPPVARLYANLPNPFNPNTVIRFDLARPAHVTLRVFDVSGRMVRTLLDEHRDGAAHRVLWDGRDNDAHDLPSGVYLYRLTAPHFDATGKMVLLR